MALSLEDWRALIDRIEQLEAEVRALQAERPATPSR
jgi:uncharacterized protein (UPF0335 family)